MPEWAIGMKPSGASSREGDVGRESCVNSVVRGGESVWGTQKKTLMRFCVSCQF